MGKIEKCLLGAAIFLAGGAFSQFTGLFVGLAPNHSPYQGGPSVVFEPSGDLVAKAKRLKIGSTQGQATNLPQKGVGIRCSMYVSPRQCGLTLGLIAAHPEFVTQIRRLQEVGSRITIIQGWAPQLMGAYLDSDGDVAIFQTATEQQLREFLFGPTKSD